MQVYNYRMQDNDPGFYSSVLQLIKDPVVLNTLGGIIITAGAAANRSVINFFSKVWSWWTKKFHKTNGSGYHELTTEYSRGGLQILTLLENLRAQLGCARVSVLQFHNGHRFSLSDPVFKMSTTFEAIEKGFVPTSEYIRELLVANYINIIAPVLLIDNPVIVPGVFEVDKCVKDEKLAACQKATTPLHIMKIKRDDLAFCAFRTLLDNLGVEAAYTVLLTSNENGPIGIMLIQFNKLEGSKEKVQQATCAICSAKHTLQNLLYVPA